MRRRLSRSVVLGAVTALLALSLGAPSAGAAPPPGSPPPITPAPQSATVRADSVTLTEAVTLVAGERSDRAAVQVTERALRDAGVRRIVRADGPRSGRLTVWVGGPTEQQASATALRALGLDGPSGLPEGGHVLGIGAGRIVLSGVDATGTYYAAQSLKQVLDGGSRPGRKLRGLEVRDWPATPIRGVIEGFYGFPWSHEARLDQLDFYGAHKMNIYAYSPKDDPYLREKWREPYPADQLARIKELVDRARERHVEFSYALSPGLSVCYSSDADAEALTDKFRTLWDIGVRTFAVPLDDISYTDWNCPADEERWGTGGGAAGAAQAHLLNRVNKDFIAAHEGAEPLQMVPTEYYDVKETPYKKALREQLDKDVLVEWTGVGVVAPTMSVAEAKQARSVFGHPILTWDNYPVNDYVPGRLLLGPFTGREAGLAEQLAGITANPMVQPYASKLALHTVADYTWNDRAYDPAASWKSALRELAGGEGRTADALEWFADASHESALDPRPAPRLAASVEKFWRDGDAARLDRDLAAFGRAPAVLRAHLPEQGFLDDAAPWLDAAEAWAAADRTALDMLTAARSGETARAWKLRQKLPRLLAHASSFTVDVLDGRKVRALVAEGVADTFADEATAAFDRLLGVPGRPKAGSDLGTYQSNAPARMTDGDDLTYYWSDGAPGPGDAVTLDLRSVRELGTVTLAMGTPGSPEDYLHKGVLEYSADGKDWKELETFTGREEVTVTAPEGTEARYLRARASAAQENWLAVREFGISGRVAEVTGGPAAAEGSSLASAADGDPGTLYRAARAPEADESLTVTLESARELTSLTVLQPEGHAVAATVEVHGEEGWRPVGEVARPFDRLDVKGGADAVRLRWRAGGAAPQIAEVIPG
ncbi:beta-N-acetylglucosaminidase domain-containing protein [Streptomyces physcomitrii]|uniref:beta-N-acetylglucosaminidase domain-containing protein n=1 Tax=Streptomyces physcomitrii TaxID=2724184 RepID=UPI003417EE1E